MDVNKWEKSYSIYLSLQKVTIVVPLHGLVLDIQPLTQGVEKQL